MVSTGTYRWDAGTLVIELNGEGVHDIDAFMCTEGGGVFIIDRNLRKWVHRETPDAQG
jgi:hypothetical protein